MDIRPWVWVLAGAAAGTACGGQSAPQPVMSPPRGPATSVSTPAGAAPAPASMGGEMPVANGPGTTDEGDALTRWEALLDREADALSSTTSDCRVICRASEQICTASGEICALTGDGDDPRCRRSREACDSARQRRAGACPVCPRT